MQVYLDAAAIIYINILELFALAVKIEIKMSLYGNLLESGSYGFFSKLSGIFCSKSRGTNFVESFNPCPHLHTLMASCRQGYLELDSSGNSGKWLVVLTRVHQTGF